MFDETTWRDCGVLVIERFLPRARVRELTRRIERADASSLGYVDEHFQARRDPHVRDGDSCELGARVSMTEQTRFEALLPRLRRFFRVPLAAIENPQFFRYRRGHHFVPHVDTNEASDNMIGRRRVTLAVTLRPCDRGGHLLLYGVVPNPLWKHVPVAVNPAPGSLVAFRADTLHTVTPIDAGTRMSLVTWAHAPNASAKLDPAKRTQPRQAAPQP